jgi:hypothetical protein
VKEGVEYKSIMRSGETYRKRQYLFLISIYNKIFHSIFTLAVK